MSDITFKLDGHHQFQSSGPLPTTTPTLQTDAILNSGFYLAWRESSNYNYLFSMFRNFKGLGLRIYWKLSEHICSFCIRESKGNRRSVQKDINLEMIVFLFKLKLSQLLYNNSHWTMPTQKQSKREHVKSQTWINIKQNPLLINTVLFG